MNNGKKFPLTLNRLEPRVHLVAQDAPSKRWLMHFAIKLIIARTVKYRHSARIKYPLPQDNNKKSYMSGKLINFIACIKAQRREFSCKKKKKMKKTSIKNLLVKRK